MYGNKSPEKGIFRQNLEISGSDPSMHTITVESVGVNGEGGGDDVSVPYSGFGTRPVLAP